jgi:hypothetical protein
MCSSLGSSRRYLEEGRTHLFSLLFCITSPRLYVLSKLAVTLELTHLPKCERHSGFRTKLNTCVGCEGYITPGDHSHFCLFIEIRYELDGTFFTPFWNQYHPECIKVGKSFKTRLVRATLGLQYPPEMTRFPFICEACTIRAILGRGAYLDVRRYAAFDARTYAPHRYGARLGFTDLAGYSKIPWLAHKFRTEIRHRNIPQSLGRFRVHSPDALKDGGRDKIQHFQKPPVSSLCLPPLGVNAPITRSHVPG